MARPATGSEVLERARIDIAKARTVDELRAAQSVVLPLDFGLSLQKTAEIVGRSAAWVARERRRYIKAAADLPAKAKWGGRRNQLVSEQEEIELVRRGVMTSAYRWDKPRDKIRELFSEKIGYPIPDSTLDSIIARVARKTIPGGTGADLRNLDRHLSEKWLRERVLVQKRMGKKFEV